MFKTLKISFLSILIPMWILFMALLWFIPWSFVLHSGLLIYFPYHKDGHSRFVRVTGPVSALWSDTWVDGKDIPSTCREALVASEDASFYDHHGIDLKSIEENLERNQRAQKIKRGGSTITQQLVKNAFLSRERTYLRKSREITGAVMLDFLMGKHSQQTWYLNIIEFGPEIYGIAEASRFYFKTPAARLSPSQCVALVTIIPSPRKWNRGLISHRPTTFFIQRYFRILARMRQMDLDTPTNLARARSMELWTRQ